MDLNFPVFARGTTADGGTQGKCIPSVYFSEIREIDNNKKFSSTPPFCFLPCVFFYSIRVDPGQDPTSLLSLKICTPVANTGKLSSIGQMPVLTSPSFYF